MKAKLLSDVLTWCGNRPFISSLLGTFTGVSCYAILHWSGSSRWIESHPGLASWVQAIGSVAALAWGVWIYRRSVKDKYHEDLVQRQNIAAATKAIIQQTHLHFRTTRKYYIWAARGGDLDFYLPIRELEYIDDILSEVKIHDLADVVKTLHVIATRTAITRFIDILNSTSEFRKNITERKRVKYLLLIQIQTIKTYEKTVKEFINDWN